MLKIVVLLSCLLAIADSRLMIDDYRAQMRGKGLGYRGLDRLSIRQADVDTLRPHLEAALLSRYSLGVVSVRSERAQSEQLGYKLANDAFMTVSDIDSKDDPDTQQQPLVFATVHRFDEVTLTMQKDENEQETDEPRGDKLIIAALHLHEDYDHVFTLIEYRHLRYIDGNDDEQVIAMNADVEDDVPQQFEATSSDTRSDEKEDGDEEEILKLLCLNIWNLNHPWTQRLGMIVDLIVELDVDVVLLQEVRYDFLRQWQFAERNAGGDPLALAAGRFQIDQLASALPGYQFAYAPAMAYLEMERGGFHVDEGVAVMSRLRIVNASAVRLSRDLSDAGDEHQRVLQHVEVRTARGDVPVHLFNTHLTLSDKARSRSAREIWAHVQAIGGDERQLLGGDFNSEPSDPLVRHLVDAPGDFVDLFDATANEGDQGFTFESWEPRKRIDFVLARRWPAVAERVAKFEIVGRHWREPALLFDALDDDKRVYLSDHFGILVHLRV
jgi:endonuclease/exonuclease/phosphatase family metal-dependent hydrolase